MKTILLTIALLLSLPAFADIHKDYDYLHTSEKIIALTILGEARGEGKSGMYAVACVLRQRAINRKMKVDEVCWQYKQFECWTGKGINDLAHLFDESKQMRYAIELARSLNRNIKFDRTYVNNADHYCTLKTNPYWAKGKKPVKIIGNHKFFKLK